MKALLPDSPHPRVVIIGGGFGGITLAQGLRNSSYQVVMLDRNNYHTFQPLLYQVATGGLEPDSIAFPLRKMFSKQTNLVFRMAEVEEVNPSLKYLKTSIGDIDYDHLVLATGSMTNFFGMSDLEEHALGMKNIPESLDLRSMILQHFEEALESPAELHDQLMSFVVVGGGPTGVETAGALAELKRHILPSDYPELDIQKMKVYLIEAGKSILPAMSEQSSQDARRSLESLGVNVLTSTMVSGYDGKTVSTHQGAKIQANTMIWAAGIKGATIHGIAPEHIVSGNRIKVNRLNEVAGLKDVYAIGDIAWMQTEDYPDGHPQVAPAAIQQGTTLATNLTRKSSGAPLRPFTYFDKGAMATIGRNRAVVDFRQLHLSGFVAWAGWMFIHLIYLIGFRNKLIVLVNWVWNYITYDKGNRLIIRPYHSPSTPRSSGTHSLMPSSRDQDF